MKRDLPADWHNAYTKGIRNECSNYREMSLSIVVNKICASVLVFGVTSKLEDVLNHFGFRQLGLSGSDSSSKDRYLRFKRQ